MIFMLLKLFQGIIDGLASLLHGLSGLLPQSPFDGLAALTLENDVLQGLAYLLPLPQILSTLEAWAIAVGIYYLYMIPMRWAKAVE